MGIYFSGLHFCITRADSGAGLNDEISMWVWFCVQFGSTGEVTGNRAKHYSKANCGTALADLKTECDQFIHDIPLSDGGAWPWFCGHICDRTGNIAQDFGRRRFSTSEEND